MNKQEFNIERKKEGDVWVDYLDLIITFDIETTSFKDNGEKRGTMYNWMMCINDEYYTGRTWRSWFDILKEIIKTYELNTYRRVIVWVHNLAYEFQWIQHYFVWNSVFARENRSPMKATTMNGFEFRCSYILSGKSLELTAKEIPKSKWHKMVGDLDYTKLRGTTTQLTKEEKLYCEADVRILVDYIRMQKEIYKKLTKIPLTNTGRVRLLCKEKCLSKENYKNYHNLMQHMTIESDEYVILKRAFQGGFTHANFIYVEDKIKNVYSKDFTSSYPAVMLSEKYPMSKGRKVKKTYNDIRRDKHHLYVFNVKYKNLRLKEGKFETPLSISKCFNKSNVRENNGRVLSADEVISTITNIDLISYDVFYDYDEVKIGDCYEYDMSYLPKPFFETILSLYEDKTTLKDVVGQEVDYQLKKGMLNSTYGMAVMKIDSEDVFYYDEWKKEKGNLEEQLKKYNEDSRRFLSYTWGVFITSYARRNLFMGIDELGEDFIYSDTDSVKAINYEKHKDWFEKYNNFIIKKLENACNFHKIDSKRIKPKTIKGQEKPLGVWDDDGNYENFKTLGAKRYIVENDGKIKATIAGVSKKKVSEWLTNQEDGFETFNDGMEVPSQYSGKLVSTYIDYETKGEFVDYLGNKQKYHEMSSINLDISEYKLGISEMFRYLLDAKHGFMI